MIPAAGGRSVELNIDRWAFHSEARSVHHQRQIMTLESLEIFGTSPPSWNSCFFSKNGKTWCFHMSSWFSMIFHHLFHHLPVHQKPHFASASRSHQLLQRRPGVFHGLSHASWKPTILAMERLPPRAESDSIIYLVGASNIQGFLHMVNIWDNIWIIYG